MVIYTTGNDITPQTTLLIFPHLCLQLSHKQNNTFFPLDHASAIGKVNVRQVFTSNKLFWLGTFKTILPSLNSIYNLADPPIIPFTNPENCFKIDSSKYNASRPAFNDFSFCLLSKVKVSNVKTL